MRYLSWSLHLLRHLEAGFSHLRPRTNLTKVRGVSVTQKAISFVASRFTYTPRDIRLGTHGTNDRSPIPVTASTPCQYHVNLHSRRRRGERGSTHGSRSLPEFSAGTPIPREGPRRDYPPLHTRLYIIVTETKRPKDDKPGLRQCQFFLLPW